jgi:two-component system sensor histidine kinase/response regulator
MEPLYQNIDINILVIDDNTENIQIIGQVLLSQGYNVSFATSGSEALKLLEPPEFDLILLDILMPEMDGFEVCRKIKNNPASSHVPIIFLTAKSDKQSIISGFELGANDYIVKPFNDRELLMRVKTQIDLMKQREELENINVVLENKVKEKTVELTSANEKLAVLEKAKSDFLSLISHELRTPLNIINGFTEVLQESLSNTNYIDELNHLKLSTDKLISLSTTALLITEIQLGKYEIYYNDVDLAAVCENISANLKQLNEEHAFTHEVVVKNNSPIVEGDENLISNIIEKLLENAILAGTENCKIEFIISDCESGTQLEVKDNGPGFSESDLDRLFNLFSKNGPDPRREGFGLGLAAAKLAMDLHSGSVKAENLDEGGAVVTLIFPSKS